MIGRRDFLRIGGASLAGVALLGVVGCGEEQAERNGFAVLEPVTAFFSEVLASFRQTPAVER